MNPALLATASAFGLASAAGLNTALPLLLVGLAARFGLVTLVAPFDALGSDVALIGLAVFSAIEFGADKLPLLDSLFQAAQWPLAATAGAILFASQNSVIREVSPGLTILIGLLLAGGVHGLRMSIRPALNLATFGLGAPFVSLLEDLTAIGLTLLALLAPLLALLALLGVGLASLRLIAASRRAVARTRTRWGV